VFFMAFEFSFETTAFTQKRKRVYLISDSQEKMQKSFSSFKSKRSNKSAYREKLSKIFKNFSEIFRKENFKICFLDYVPKILSRIASKIVNGKQKS